jgi:hypothetical protein
MCEGRRGLEVGPQQTSSMAIFTGGSFPDLIRGKVQRASELDTMFVGGNHHRSPGDQLDPDEKQLSDALYESKMDHVRQQYEHILLDQLEQQRTYFEELLAMSESRGAATVKDIEQALEDAAASTSAAVAAQKDALAKLRSCEAKLV